MASILLYLTYTVCIIGIIGDLSSIYFINNIWAFRKHKFIQSRSPTLTYSVLWIFFSLLLLAVANALMYTLTDFWDAIYFFIINDAIQYGCTFAYATRAWILFYHVEWSYESVNHIWRTQLSEAEAHVSQEVLHSHSNDVTKKEVKEFADDAALFWMNYRDSLGNYKKVFPMTMGLLFPLFIFLLDILPYQIFNIHDSNNQLKLIIRIINILCYLVIFTLILILIRRIHLISDKYSIGHELKSINICFAVFILIGKITNGILIFIVGFDDIMTFIAGFCSIASILCSIYIGSFFVLRKLFAAFATNDSMKQFTNNNKFVYKIVTICPNQKLETIKTNANSELKLTLNRLLATQYGFETFTQFLISELSVENILFLVEVKQYKACCRKYHKSEKTPVPMDDNDNGQTNTISYKNATFSTVAPSLRPTTTTKSKPNVFKSKSIMNVDYVPSNRMLQSLDPYDYAMYLYHKYVIDGSDLQINIPSKTRKNLTKFLIKTSKTDIILLDDYIDQMFKLYDKAWEQIHTLIKSDSYSRFRYTTEYNDCCIRIRAKEENDKKHKQENDKNQQKKPNDFLNKHAKSILDWEYTEMVMIEQHQSPNISGVNSSIPEDAELDDMDNMDAELQKLNSIGKYEYNTERKNKVDELDNIEEAIEVLNDIPDFDDENNQQP